VTTVLHEFGHGLGFQTFTDDATGEQIPSDEDPNVTFPSIWDYFLFDPQQGKNWAQMTDAERATSAITPRNLVWSGKQVTKNAHKVLDRGTPELFIAGGGLNQFMFIGTAEFGPPIDKKTLIASEMAHVVDQTDGRRARVHTARCRQRQGGEGKVAVIDRGSCTFSVKVKNAQVAGAKAVIIADNAPARRRPTWRAPTTRLPFLRCACRWTMASRSRPRSPPRRRGGSGRSRCCSPTSSSWPGADFLDRVFMYTPNPNQPGSSVSHYDTLATPNLLMEPFDSPHQPIAVSPPNDLTLQLLLDIGW
jgi:hypothetical protein